MSERRPLRSRDSRWAKTAAQILLATPLTPNQVSLLSILCALGAGFCFLMAPSSPYWLLGAAAGIQCRLLCNLLDGMLAVEGGRNSPLGSIYNEFPDRVADVVILVSAGFSVAGTAWASQSVTLGWLSAVLAVGTAYVRAFGSAVGAGELYLGPMAKPHRMAALTAGCLLEIVLRFSGIVLPTVPLTLLLIAAGAIVTLARRTARIARHLEEREQ